MGNCLCPDDRIENLAGEISLILVKIYQTQQIYPKDISNELNIMTDDNICCAVSKYIIQSITKIEMKNNIDTYDYIKESIINTIVMIEEDNSNINYIIDNSEIIKKYINNAIDNIVKKREKIYDNNDYEILI